MRTHELVTILLLLLLERPSCPLLELQLSSLLTISALFLFLLSWHSFTSFVFRLLSVILWKPNLLSLFKYSCYHVAHLLHAHEVFSLTCSVFGFGIIANASATNQTRITPSTSLFNRSHLLVSQRISPATCLILVETEKYQFLARQPSCRQAVNYLVINSWVSLIFEIIHFTANECPDL